MFRFMSPPRRNLSGSRNCSERNSRPKPWSEISNDTDEPSNPITLKSPNIVGTQQAIQKQGMALRLLDRIFLSAWWKSHSNMPPEHLRDGNTTFKNWKPRANQPLYLFIFVICMCALAFFLTEGMNHMGMNTRSLAPILSILLWQIAGNVGFVYSNYVTTARSHPIVGLHGGFRDFVIINLMIPILALACTGTTGISHHLFPENGIHSIAKGDSQWINSSRVLGFGISQHDQHTEVLRGMPLWHRVWLNDRSNLVTINNFIQPSVPLSEVSPMDFSHQKKGTFELSLYEYFHEEQAIQTSLMAEPQPATPPHPEPQSSSISFNVFGFNDASGHMHTDRSIYKPATYDVPILHDYESYLSSQTESMSPFSYLLHSPITALFHSGWQSSSLQRQPDPFRYRGLCLVLTFLAAFVLGTHTPYAARSGPLAHSVSAKEYSSGRFSVIFGVGIKVFLVCFAVLQHFRWLLYIPMQHLFIRLAIYAVIFFSIIAITCISSPSYYLHLHHWAMGMFLVPMALTSCIYWTCFLQGFAVSQFVEGASRWSCAPLWHARVCNETFVVRRKSVLGV